MHTASRSPFPHRDPQRSPSRRRRTVGTATGLVLRRLLPLLVLAALTAPPARADGCDGCSGPTLEQLQGQPGFALQVRTQLVVPPLICVPPFMDSARDYVLTDAGECTATLAGPPHVTRLCAWLVLRGRGEVWDCPHSKSTATITVEAGSSDSSEWTVRATTSLKMKALAAEATFEVEQGHTSGATIHEITRISQTITPTYCHRVAWWGYFEVGHFQAEAEFNFTQRWAWWTKNRLTGAKVHAKGDITMDCGSGQVELERKAPVAGYFDLSQRGCNDPLCGLVLPKSLGFFPPLPPYLPDPEKEGEEPAPIPASAAPEEPQDPADPADPDPEDADPEDTDPEDADPEDADPEDAAEPPVPETPSESGELGEPPAGPLPDPLADRDPQ